MNTIITRMALLVIPIGMLFSSAQAQDEGLSKKEYIIWDSKAEKKIKFDQFIEQLQEADVVFYGESHNDSNTHVLQNMVFKALHQVHGEKMVLSMEQFDRDKQYIVDEYLNDQIKESYFKKDAKPWQNFESDYKPMFDYAKTNKLKVIAANAPFRYVNVASNKGMDALMKLSDRAKSAMAPLPYDTASGTYRDKLIAMMSHGGGAKMTYNIVMGQSLWDNTMAWSIHEHILANKGAKIFHINGKFHTDERYGIVQRLAGFAPELKALVISGENSLEDFRKVKFKEHGYLGDYVIFTDKDGPKSY